MIRGLALGHIGDSNKRELLMKEAAIGLLNGITWALIIGAIVVVWKGEWMLGGIISAAMMTNLIVVSIAGVSIPILLKKMNIDPALCLWYGSDHCHGCDWFIRISRSSHFAAGQLVSDFPN